MADDTSFADNWNTTNAETAKIIERRRAEIIKNLEQAAGLDGNPGSPSHDARVQALCKLWDIVNAELKSP
jgi:hypothetical protein